MQALIYPHRQKVANLHGIYGLLAPPMTPLDPATRVRQRIARLLEDRGFTQRQMAKSLGHGDQWASNLLSGRSQLTWDDFDKVAKFLRVPPSELVRLSEDAWELTPTEMRVVRALRMLPVIVRDHLVTLADYLVGATPDEVELLAQVRALTEEEMQGLQHYLDTMRRASGVPHRTTTPEGHPLTDMPPHVVVARRRRRAKP